VNEGIRVSMHYVPADTSTITFMLPIVIPMSEALRVADNKLKNIFMAVVHYSIHHCFVTRGRHFGAQESVISYFFEA
jgi:hypothetical protein